MVPRSQAIQAAFQSAQSRLPEGASLQDFEAATQDWECHPVCVGGSVVGAVLVHGPEIHACIKPEGFGRWLNRSLLCIVDKTVARYGYALTQAATDAGRAFVERLGFRATQAAPSVFLKVNHGH